MKPRNRKSLILSSTVFAFRLKETEKANAADIVAFGGKKAGSSKGAFASPVKDFYLTNPIARASAIMAECSALAQGGFQQAAE